MSDPQKLAQAMKELDQRKEARVAEATRPNAVDVAKVAAPILALIVRDGHPERPAKTSQDIAVEAAFGLIAEAQRQLDQERGASTFTMPSGQTFKEGDVIRFDGESWVKATAERGQE